MLKMLDNKIPSPTEPATETADGENLVSKDPVIEPTGETLQVPEAVDNAAGETFKVSEVSDTAAG